MLPWRADLSSTWRHMVSKQVEIPMQTFRQSESWAHTHTHTHTKTHPVTHTQPTTQQTETHTVTHTHTHTQTHTHTHIHTHTKIQSPTTAEALTTGSGWKPTGSTLRV